MKIRIAIFAALAMVLAAQTWKGGNTADYDANSVCSDVYLLHRPGTDFPADTRAECCAETTFTWGGIDTLITEHGDTVIVPVPPGYGHDTTVVLTVGAMHFTTWNEYVCDSIILGIDTLVSPYDTSTCVFCDSIMNIAWFTMDTLSGDTILFDVWHTITGIDRDSCGVLISTGYINIEGDYYEGDFYEGEHITYEWCFDCDTIIYNYYGDTVDWRFWLKDSSTGEVTLVEYQDTVTISHPPYGVWVKECGCTTGVDTTITTLDSLDAFLCLSEAWNVWHTANGVYRAATSPLEPGTGPRSGDILYQYARHTVDRSTTVGSSPTAIMAMAVDHDGYFQGYADTVTTLFNAGDRVATNIGDSLIDVGNVFYYLYNNASAAYAGFQGDTQIVVHGDTYYAYAWDMFSEGFMRHAWKFRTTFDFKNFYSLDELAVINDVQPEWYVLAAADDIVPFVKVQGEAFDLDAEPNDYDVKIYTIKPEINYFEPISIETGTYSKAPPYNGGQILFALHYEDTIISESCWTYRDSIVLPPCGMTLDDCADSICFKFPQGWAPYEYFMTAPWYFRATGDIIYCVSTCDLDTLDLSATPYGDSLYGEMEWIFSPLQSVSADSVDTFSIITYNDSIVLRDTDGDGDPIKIDMDISIPSRSLIFSDSTLAGKTWLCQIGDTLNISCGDADTLTILKLGSGSMYLSDRAIWCSYSYCHPLDAGGSIALGDADSVFSSHSAAFGSRNSLYAAKSFSAGDNNKAFSPYAHMWGGSNLVANGFGTAWGKSNNIFGLYSTIAGGYYCQTDSSATYSFLIGMNDTLSADSTFRSAYPYNEFMGTLQTGTGPRFSVDSLSGDSLFISIDGATKVFRAE